MAAKKYKGSSHLARLITRYMELRKTNQTQVGKRIGRSQPSISHLMRGSESADKTKPYFGMKGPTSEDDPLLLLVARDLRIPWSEVEEALNADLDEFMQHRMNLGRQRLAEKRRKAPRKQSRIE